MSAPSRIFLSTHDWRNITTIFPHANDGADPSTWHVLRRRYADVPCLKAAKFGVVPIKHVTHWQSIVYKGEANKWMIESHVSAAETAHCPPNNECAASRNQAASPRVRNISTTHIFLLALGSNCVQSNVSVQRPGQLMSLAARVSYSPCRMCSTGARPTQIFQLIPGSQTTPADRRSCQPGRRPRRATRAWPCSPVQWWRTGSLQLARHFE